MTEARISKPIVFLSHSKKDVAFIKMVEADLKRAHIDTWLDEYDIRHGEPWLGEIFEYGMPRCDAILAYLTKSSIESSVVSKEIDVAILRKLKDKHVAFLPYVSTAELRDQLRPDLQTLHAPEWNQDNYSQLLPCVVSQIWRAFTERTVSSAVREEKLARVEAENRLLEIEKAQSASIFPEGERKDFKYIWEQLNRFECVQVELTNKTKKQSCILTAQMNVCSVIPMLSAANNFVYKDTNIWGPVVKKALAASPVNDRAPDSYKPIQFPSLSEELLRYGFLSRLYKGRPQQSSTSHHFSWFENRDYDLIFTERLERFKYWLAVVGDCPSDVEVKDVSIAKETDGEYDSNNGQASKDAAIIK